MSAYSQKRTLGASLNWNCLSVLGPDRLGAEFHHCRQVVSSGVSEEGGIVLQAQGHVRVLGSQRPFPDRQRPIVQRLSLGVVALGRVQ